VEDYYTTTESARILGITEGRVRQLLNSGELEGKRDVNERWRIPQHAVHARKEERAPSREPTRLSADVKEWIEQVGELRQELGRLEGRLQITEVAESTLRESLERERERADRLEERAEKLRDELEAERSKGFWARLFGG
jgi:excisionase family DNA binding protein